MKTGRKLPLRQSTQQTGRIKNEALKVWLIIKSTQQTRKVLGYIVSLIIILKKLYHLLCTFWISTIKICVCVRTGIILDLLPDT